MQKTIRMAAIAALFVAAPLGAAFADRAPSADETIIISNVLLDEGFSSWGQIEWDGNEWKVHNAIDQDGNRRDLVLDPQFMVLDDGEDSLVHILN